MISKDCYKNCQVIDALINSYDDLSFITNKNNEILAINKNAVEFLKLYDKKHTLKNLIGRKLNDVFIECGFDFEVKRQLIIDSLEEGKTSKLLKSVNNYIHEISATPIRGSDMIVLHIKDITENFRYQEEIKKKSNELENIIDNMNRSFALHEMIFDEAGIAKDYNFIRVNKSFYKSTGFKEDVIGKSVTKVLGKEAKVWIELYSNIFTSDKPLHFEKYLETFGKWYSIDAYRQNHNNFVTIFEDITSNKNKEIQQTDIINSTLTASFLTDIEGTILNINERGCRYFSKPKNEILGKRMSELLPREVAEQKRKRYLESIFTGQPLYFVDEVNGRYIENYIYPILDSKNAIQYVAIHGRDITQQKKNEIELETSKIKAEQSDSLKSLFLANMSHEIKTPMNAILGFSDILLDPEYDGLYKEKFLKSINTNAKHLEELLNNILDYTKIESGEMDLLYEKFLINDLFTELEEIFSYVNYKQNREAVKLMFEKRSKEDKIISDYLRLKQILYNLISNAIKFTEVGHIRIGCRLKDNNIIFFVEDTGMGIPENKLDVIFKKFVQVDETTKKRYQGTGLGLSISKGLVEALGGNIWVDSKESVGSTFFFSLPYDAQVKIIDTKPAQEIDFSHLLILLIDEVPENYSYLNIILKSLGVKIDYANNIDDAIHKITKNNFDVVFIDSNIIKIIDLAEKIKQFNKNLPIINIGVNEIEDINIDNNLVKPITKEKIIQLLKNLNDD